MHVVCNVHMNQVHLITSSEEENTKKLKRQRQTTILMYTKYNTIVRDVMVLCNIEYVMFISQTDVAVS